MKWILNAVICLLIVACNTPKTAEKEMSQEEKKPPVVTDPHSFAEPKKAVVTHLSLDAKVDFEKKIIKGNATYDIKTADDAKTIHFDTDELEILSVTNGKGEELPFELSKRFRFLGKKLSVSLTNGTEKVSIEYVTSPTAKALQWLSPQQTADKKHPFLFTQSQAILARTWIPTQDSPGIRFTYDAKIEVPKGLMAIMSAQNPKELAEDGIYTFEMKQAVPGYLMAMAVGGFEYAPIGPRTGIYAEPSMVKASVYEFADMEKMVEAAEKLYGPYAWEQFDMIVLPPSFPFGGMENPRVTFATPTIIAGDRSLTALVAHELAHSWSGNLVTNATWNDFWLNEGFTVYFERRIMESLYGKDYAEMLAEIGYQDLMHTLSDLGKDSEDTRLKLELTDRDPDDGMTDIAYEKGYFLLRLLEETLGREKFDAFLRDNFQKNAFETKTTEQFLVEIKEYFKDNKEALAAVNLEKWIYEPGLPENCPEVNSTRFLAVEQAIEDFVSDTDPAQLQTAEWSSHEWLHFLRNLPNNLSKNQLAQLDLAFGFTKSNNSEILAAWFQHTIQKNYSPADAKVDSFLTTVGRRKFLVPTYKALIEADPSKKQALAIYAKARKNYHSVSTGTLDKMLGWNGK